MAKQVKPIPEGFHSLTPHLTVRDAAGMIDFYKRAFGAVELNRAPGPDGKGIMHALLRIGGSNLWPTDESPPMKCFSPLAFEGTAVAISLYVDNVDAVFQQAVEAGG